MPRRVNLIPMAGAGQRFVDAGYRVPKPLITVAGEPMIMQAAASLPPADLWIFACRSEHLEGSDLAATLRRRFDPCVIVPVARLTEGQASTCLLAREHLRPDDELTIGACDNAMTWSRPAFERVRSEADFLVWTFRHNPAVLQDPRMYGWVRTEAGERVTAVSVKVPISENPLEDHAVIGAFTFRRAGLFLDACDDMIRANARIRNEFYVDNAVNFALARGARGRVFEVDRYVCWGTPRDLDTFNYWRGYFVPEGAAGDRAE